MPLYLEVNYIMHHYYHAATEDMVYMDYTIGFIIITHNYLLLTAKK